MPWKTPGASPDFSPNNKNRLSLHGINSFVRKKSCQEERQPYDYTVYPEMLPISSPKDERFTRSLTGARLPARVVGYCCQRWRLEAQSAYGKRIGDRKGSGSLYVTRNWRLTF